MCLIGGRAGTARAVGVRGGTKCGWSVRCVEGGNGMTGHDRSMSLMHPMPGLRWTEFRDAATDYASHGWPVLPGTYQLDGHTEWYGKHGAMGLEPAADMWAMTATADAAVALEWWTRRPYSVLLACGAAVDALEIDADHGRRSRAPLAERGHLGPIIATPFGRWLLLVRSDGEVSEELATAVRLHTRGVSLWFCQAARSVGGW